LNPQVLAEDYAQGLPASRRWFAIPNFVDCARFAPGDRAAARRQFGLPAEATVVLEAAALKIPQKRLDYLMAEFREAKRAVPRLELVIAGASGPETPAVEALAGDDVRLLKDVPPEQMPALYRAADLFAHAALREPLGIAFLEALASGIPCLGHHYPVTRWVIGPGGQTLDLEQPGQLAAALRAYAEDPARRLREGQAGREHVLREFETRRVVDQIVAMYEAVLAT
jgi:glycosyltransferase involved in cell wall biosynthesis